MKRIRACSSSASFMSSMSANSSFSQKSKVPILLSQSPAQQQASKLSQPVNMDLIKKIAN